MTKIHSGHAPAHRSAQSFDNPQIVKPTQVSPQSESTAPLDPLQNLAVRKGSDTNFLRSRLDAKWQTFQAGSNHSREKVEVVHISADQRHKGVSPFDKLPHFERRTKAFPDRYRAVNPRLAAAGVKGKAALRFPLKPGAVALRDGAGVKRGTIAESSVRLNYAQVKHIDGEKYYYAFAAKIRGAHDHDNNPQTPDKTAKYKASGWIKASAVRDDPKFSQEDIKKSQPPAVSEKHGKHSDYQQYTINDHLPADFKDKNGKPRYGYFNKKGDFVSYKVLPGVPLMKNGKKTNVAASDYLQRPGGVVNLGFNPAGMSNDTLKINYPNNPAVFHRAPKSLKGTTVEVDLYRPKTKNSAGEKPVGKMRFVYGYVEYKGEHNKTEQRWGWIPRAALNPRTAAQNQNAQIPRANR